MTATKKKTKSAPLEQKMDPWEKPIPFTEDFKWPGGRKRLTFTAESYNAWTASLLTPEMARLRPIVHLKKAMNTEGEEGRSFIRVGEDFVFHMKRFPLVVMQSPDFGYGGGMFAMLSLLSARPTRATLHLHRGNSVAHSCFSEIVSIPVLADKDANPWMSLTPNEVMTQRAQLRRAKKHTAIAGMGMGWVARRILERPKVTKLTVVEKNPAIAEFFGGPLKAQFGDKLEIVVADAYDHDWTPYDVTLWDIWPGVNDAKYDRKFQTLKQQLTSAGKVCVGWGDSIGRD